MVKESQAAQKELESQGGVGTEDQACEKWPD